MPTTHRGQRRELEDDLVQRIVRAVRQGDGATLNVLLAVLDAIADEPMLCRLSAEMSYPTPPATAGGMNAAG